MRFLVKLIFIIALWCFSGFALAQVQIHGFEPDEPRQGQPVSAVVQLVFCIEFPYRDADGQPFHDFVIEDNVINLDVKMGFSPIILLCLPPPPPELLTMPDVPAGNYILRLNKVELEVVFPATDSDRELRDEVEFIQGTSPTTAVDSLDTWASLLLLLLIFGLASSVLWVKRA